MRKLGNEGFVSKAPAEMVDAEKTKLAELEGQLTAMTDSAVKGAVETQWV